MYNAVHCPVSYADTKRITDRVRLYLGCQFLGVISPTTKGVIRPNTINASRNRFMGALLLKVKKFLLKAILFSGELSPGGTWQIKPERLSKKEWALRCVTTHSTAADSQSSREDSQISISLTLNRWIQGASDMSPVPQKSS